MKKVQLSAKDWSDLVKFIRAQLEAMDCGNEVAKHELAEQMMRISYQIEEQT